MSITKKTSNLPKPIQLLLRYICGNLPLSIRYGKSYSRTYNLLKCSQRWNENKLAEFQLEQLIKLLMHCQENVPYYKNAFKKLGISADSVTSLSDLQKLPMLTKDIIREHHDSLKSTNFSNNMMEFMTTGGSSGVPLSFYSQKGFSREREMAFISIMWERAGFKFARDERLVLRGSVPDSTDGIEYQPATKELVCSTYYTDDTHLQSYYEAMKKRKIEFIHGHVSSVALFAQYMVSNGLYYPLKAVFGGSEKVYPFQRELVKKAFGARLFSWYGQTEQVALAGACEHSELYHVFPEYGVLELIDENGKVIDEPGIVGEIVATGFNNYVMPFIRYKTGDMAKYANDFCEYCGRKYRLLEAVEGRSYEYVITGDGRKVSLTGLIFGQHFEAFAAILKMQVYQEKAGDIEIRIVPGKGYIAQKHEAEISDTIHKAVGGDMEINFVYMEQIPLSAGRKHQFLIQRMDMEI